MVRGCQLPVNAKFLVQRFDESGRKLQSSVTDDASWEPIKSEYIVNMMICNAFGIDLIRDEGEVCRS